MGENFMHDSPRPLYARAGALGAAALLAVSGAFIAGPAMATTGDTPQPATTEAPAAPSLDGVDAPAGGAAAVAPGLKEALQRDLGMTVEEFVAEGALGKKASDALEQLKATEGFVSIEVVDGALVITGSGEDLKALAEELDATVVEPTAPATEEAAGETASPAPSASTPPAPTEEAAESGASEVKTASDLQALVSEYVEQVGSENLRWVARNGNSFSIAVGEPLGQMKARGMAAKSADEFAAAYSNVKIEQSGIDALTTFADENSVLNGSGYVIPTGGTSVGLCSVGFAGFNPAGADAVITAGHCANDGTASATRVEIPSAAEEVTVGDALGVFGTYSYNGTEGAAGTDVAVIDSINPALDLLPETTQWTAPDQLLSADTVKIAGTTSAVVGAPVCKSGRTTFWTCGVIEEADTIFNVGDTYTNGFIASIDGAPGDSGGSMISGNLALGLVSAGTTGLIAGADINRALAATGGYTVAVHLDAPALTSPQNNGTVDTDAAITGTAPAGTTVKLTVNGEDREVSAADGTWTINAPTVVPNDEKLTIKAQAVSGYNKSAVSTFELTVKEAPLPAPVFSTPNHVVDSLAAVAGTGVPGADVTLTMESAQANGARAAAGPSAAQSFTAEVNGDGQWTVTLDQPLSYGVYNLAAVQSGIPNKEASTQATLQLTVAAAAPVITNPADGSKFTQSQLPKAVTGTAKPGALVLVSFDGQAAVELQADANGNWSAPMGNLAVSSHGVHAKQVLQGAASTASYVSFVVEADPAVVVNPAPTGGLPDTGAANLGLLAGGGAGLLAAGAALLYGKRRRATVDA